MTVKLTDPQWGLLAEVAAYDYGEANIMPRARRTADILVEHGFFRRLYGGGHWVRVTPAGRAYLAGRSTPKEQSAAD